jgi:hypothetical protein
MNLKGKIWAVAAFGLLLFFCTCKKEEVPGDLVGNNNAPYYGRIPTVLIQNYVNRLFIDLIGREPLDVEMEEEVAALKATNVSFASRDSLISKLQQDETFRIGDSSYKVAYYNRLYELFKVKMLEGASDADISRERGLIYGQLIHDSLAGDWYNHAVKKSQIAKLDAVLDIDIELMNGDIEVKDAFARLLDNAVYDRINMNTFNFIRASFNDLFGRYPTSSEFDNGYAIVEDNTPAIVFGKYASNKGEFIEVLVTSNEFYEGILRWTYRTLISREPITQEIEVGLNKFYYDHDLPALQKTILVTNEYANFN